MNIIFSKKRKFFLSLISPLIIASIFLVVGEYVGKSPYNKFIREISYFFHWLPDSYITISGLGSIFVSLYLPFNLIFKVLFLVMYIVLMSLILYVYMLIFICIFFGNCL